MDPRLRKTFEHFFRLPALLLLLSYPGTLSENIIPPSTLFVTHMGQPNAATVTWNEASQPSSRLMRERLLWAQHWNPGMFLLGKASVEAPGVRPLSSSSEMFTKYSSRHSKSYSSSNKHTRSTLRKRRQKHGGTICGICVRGRGGALPHVPVAAAVVDPRGLAGAVCPQSSGPAAQTEGERTCWHSRFLYRQEVGVAAEQAPCIIGCLAEAAPCR